MWRNYLTVGLRALAKNKVYALINILGLAIGLAACLLILLYVEYERSYDGWLPESERVFQLQVDYQSRTSSDAFQNQGAPYVARAALAKDFPQIEHAVYLGDVALTVVQGDRATAPDYARLTDGSFLDVVPLPMLAGGRDALSQPGSVVLTQSEAKRLLGSTRALGQTLTLAVGGRKADYRITGILKDLPKNSHMAIDLIARVDYSSFYSATPEFLTSWGWSGGWIYAKLKPGIDVATINRQFPAWEKRNIPDDSVNGRRSNYGDEHEFALVKVRDVHLGQAQTSAMTAGNDARSIATFAVVAILILATACMNFTNLATARASQRAREVALRKVLGASRRQLIVQFLGESLLLTAIAMLLALAVTELALPWFANFLDADLSVRYFGAGGVFLPIVGLVLLVGIAGGLYPALYLSRFQPARVLKANKSAAETEGSGRLRSALVVVQFGVSIGLMACTAVIYSQARYARELDPGYRRDGLIQVTGGTAEIAEQVARVPGIRSVGRSGIGVNTGNTSSTSVMIPGRPDPIDIGIYSVDAGYFSTMGIRTLAGRVFEDGRVMDDMTTPTPEQPDAERKIIARGANIVLNEAGARRLGFANAQAAVGKTVMFSVGEEYGGTMNLNIIGVVADSRFRTVTTPIEPILFRMEREGPNWLVARYTGDPAAALAGVEKVFRRMQPDQSFDGALSDAIMARTYRRMDARGQMFGMFSILAVVVGCMGLFGLAAFTAQRRTKEIGIRKVLGARTADIVRLLVWQFTRPVLIANAVAWPVAWWAMRDWLNQYDARIALGPAPFVLAGTLALIIAVLTIGAHAIRIARTNPVYALRYE